MRIAATRVKQVVLVVAVVAALAAAGCGSKSSSSTNTGTAGTTSTHISHAKTKFVLHAGLAFGAFHHWIYKPAKAGDFRHPSLHKLTVIKAGLAGLFAYHQLKLALEDARADPTLSKLVSPITALQDKFHAVASSIKGGQPDLAAITDSRSSITSIKQLAEKAGQPVSEIVPSHP